ncbi:MAG TPA: hypothetical protein VF920_04695 [Dongiaceae bacterium]
MSAAKVPSIRARMRQQDILTFTLVGADQLVRRARPTSRRAWVGPRIGLWHRASKAVRQLTRQLTGSLTHHQTPSTTR